MSAESALLQGVFERHRLTNAAITDILRVLHTPNFDISRLAPTVFQLRKVQAVLLPSVPTEQAELASLGGTKIHYHRPLAVFQQLASEPGALDDFRWHWDANGGQIECAANTQCWKDYEDEFADLLAAGHRLLLPRINHDAYEQQTKRKRKLTAFYITFANDPEARRYLLCLVPDTRDLKDEMYRNVLDEVTSIVLLPDFADLEDGKVLVTTADGSTFRLCGSIFAIVADDIGHRQINGLLGPQATFSSRYRLLKKEHFWVPTFPYTLDDGTVLQAPAKRDPEEA
eukprot:TRINITY_DN4113_c0_g1_i2.p1 TRINITY_DN4113_c0_g1~~TRINITY_DN4113_c0_g1_i2.p1  ORF type:complete len:285 (-),score=47.43 TRINITY_DN4113_c0_g1_i2:1207-2061(-)